MKALIGSSPDVISTTHVRGRKLGPWLAFDLRMQVPFEVSVSAAKQIATKAKLRVLEGMPEVRTHRCSLLMPAPSFRPTVPSRQLSLCPYYLCVCTSFLPSERVLVVRMHGLSSLSLPSP